MGWVLFFDGECAFCSDAVRLLTRLDKNGKVSFAPLQGKLSAEKGFSDNAAQKGGSVVVLRESDGEVFTKSSAMMEIASLLGGWWRIFRLARFIPEFIRDRVYLWIADNRYRFTGKKDSCSLPDPEVLKRLRE